MNLDNKTINEILHKLVSIISSLIGVRMMLNDKKISKILHRQEESLMELRQKILDSIDSENKGGSN